MNWIFSLIVSLCDSLSPSFSRSFPVFFSPSSTLLPSLTFSPSLFEVVSVRTTYGNCLWGHSNWMNFHCFPWLHIRRSLNPHPGEASAERRNANRMNTFQRHCQSSLLDSDSLPPPTPIPQSLKLTPKPGLSHSLVLFLVTAQALLLPQADLTPIFF